METDTRAHAGSATRRRPRDRAPPRRPLPDRPRGSPAAAWPASTRPSTSGSTAPARSRSCTAGLGDDDGVRRPLRARGPRRRPALPPQRRRRLRPGRRPDVDGGTLYLVMELVPGHTLRDVIRDEAPMPPAQALALHRAGRLRARRRPPGRPDPPRHQARERPDRRRASGGRVKVADFGLAKAVSADTQHTATGGVLIGTVSYLAPELVVDGTSDARADVYAAGVVLYELLTGEQAARGRVPDRGRLQARPRGRAAAVAARARHPGVRRRAGRPRHRPRPRPAPGRRRRAAPPAPPGLPGAGRRGLGRRGAHRRPRPARRASPPSTLGAGHRRHQRLRDPADRRRPSRSRPRRRRRPPGVRAAGARRTAARAAGRASDAAARGRAARAAARCSSPSRWRSPLAAGLGAYWFGWARYTATPGVLGLTQQAADRQARPGRPRRRRSATRRTPRTSPKGRVVGTDPAPGSRVLDHGTVTLTLSLGKERYDVPKVARMTVDQAQDALLEAAPDLRPVDPALVRRLGAQGHGPRQQPGGRAPASARASRSTWS